MGRLSGFYQGASEALPDSRPYVHGFLTPATGVCEVCGERHSASQGKVVRGQAGFAHEECAGRGGDTAQGRLFNPGPRRKYKTWETG